MIGELGDGVGILAIGDEDDPAAIDIDEQENLGMAKFRGGFVDADTMQAGKIKSRQRRFNGVSDGAPEPRVVLAAEAGDGGDRHVCDERHGECLKQQRAA